MMVWSIVSICCVYFVMLLKMKSIAPICSILYPDDEKDSIDE